MTIRTSRLPTYLSIREPYLLRTAIFGGDPARERACKGIEYPRTVNILLLVSGPPTSGSCTA
jgi:hypothetical protein